MKEDIITVLTNLLDRAEKGQIEALTFGAYSPDEDEPNFGVVGELSPGAAIAMIGLNKVVEQHMVQYLSEEMVIPLYEGVEH